MKKVMYMFMKDVMYYVYISDQLLLWADQSRGTVYSYNVSTAATSVVVADPTKNIISLTADEKNIYFTAHHHK